MCSSYLLNVIKTFVGKKQQESYTFIERRLPWSLSTFIPIFTYLHLITFQYLLALNVIVQLTLGGDCGTDFTPSLGDLHSILQKELLEGEAVVSLSSLMKVPAYTTPFNRGWLRSS